MDKCRSDNKAMNNNRSPLHFSRHFSGDIIGAVDGGKHETRGISESGSAVQQGLRCV